MSTDSNSFNTWSDSALQKHYNYCLEVVKTESECSSYFSQAPRDLQAIREILNKRISVAAATVLGASASGATTDLSISPYLPSPRGASGSIERRECSTQAASALRLEGSSGHSSPPKTARGAALSAVEESTMIAAFASPNNQAIVVHAEHVAADGSFLSEARTYSTPTAIGPTIPLRVDTIHSAFVRSTVSPGTASPLSRTPVPPDCSRAISGLNVDVDSSDRPVFNGSVMPDIAAPAYEIHDSAIEPRNRRRRSSASLIAEDARSYNGHSPVPDSVTEEDLAKQAETIRQSKERYCSTDISLVNPSSDPAEDPLFTHYLRLSLQEQRKAPIR